MAIRKDTVTYACDGCGELATVAKFEPYPHYTGTVVNGANGVKAKWHACSMACVVNAVGNTLREAASDV